MKPRLKDIVHGRTEYGDRIVWGPVNGGIPGSYIAPMNGVYLGPGTPAPVLNKNDFVRRYSLGEFGNRSPTWNTLEEYLNGSDTKSLIHIRNRIAGGLTWYNVPAVRVERTYHEALATGLKPEQLYFSAMCPTEKTLINAEFMVRDDGVDYLYYSRVKKPMRDSLREGGRELTGVSVRLLLRELMNGKSLEWFEHLVASYPGHVIEFTTLSTCWGTDPGYNTLFWEVRKY